MNYGLVNKPKGPGATRRVWELADELTARAGRMARRKEVIDAYVGEGGNINTASTQYYYWKVAQEDDGKRAPTSESLSGQSSSGALRVALDTEGRLQLPVEVLRDLEVKPGEVVVLRVDNGELTVVSQHLSNRKVQGILAHLKRPDESIVDEFLKERRAMWGEE